jgi:hypothetical protein
LNIDHPNGFSLANPAIVCFHKTNDSFFTLKLVRYNVCYPRSRSKVMQKVDAGNEEETRNPQNKKRERRRNPHEALKKNVVEKHKSQAPKVVRSQDSRDQ